MVFQSCRICDCWFTGFNWLVISFPIWPEKTWKNTRYPETMSYIQYRTNSKFNRPKFIITRPEKGFKQLLGMVAISQTCSFVHYLVQCKSDHPMNLQNNATCSAKDDQLDSQPLKLHGVWFHVQLHAPGESLTTETYGNMTSGSPSQQQGQPAIQIMDR